jgi:hypothetical protein
MMRVIFTRSVMPLSQLIRWGLREPVSHMAIVFDDKVVFQSNLLGVHLVSYSKFISSSEIVMERRADLSLEDEEDVFQSISLNSEGRLYDFAGFLFFLWRGFLYRLFRTPLPSRNPWGHKDSYLCTELAESLPDSMWIFKPKDFGMSSPYSVAIAIGAKA